MSNPTGYTPLRGQTSDNPPSMTTDERLDRLEFLVARSIDVLFCYDEAIRTAFERGPISDEGREAIAEMIGMRAQLPLAPLRPSTASWWSGFSGPATPR